MIIGVRDLFGLVFLGYIHHEETLLDYIKTLSFWDKSSHFIFYFLKKGLDPLLSSPTVHQGSFVPNPLLALLFLALFGRLFDMYKSLAHCHLICIFLIIINIAHLCVSMNFQFGGGID